MSLPCTVLIAAATLLPALTPRARVEGHELLAFSEQDTLRALDAITGRRPSLVTLEEAFAVTPRGAALIKRIKADPRLASVEVRVVGPDAPADAPLADPSLSPAVETGVATPPDAGLADDALDPIGTRRAPRVNIDGTPEVLIDGNPAWLVDLSSIGAQVLSPTVLKPNQRVRVAFSDEAGTVRVNGTIVWANFEIPPNVGPRYRAGIEFASGDTAGIEDYCRRHQ